MDYYNYGMPQVNYPVVPNGMQMQQPQFQMQNECQCDNRFIWSPSKEFARSYPMGFNKTILFLNENESYAYLRKTDQEGKTSLFKSYQLIEEPEEVATPTEQSNYLSKDEFNTFSNDISNALSKLMDKIDNMDKKMLNRQNQQQSKRQVRDDG